MFEKRYRWDEVPSIGGPGVYAYFADTPDALLPVALGPGNLVYVGMTGASLKGRNHFDHEDSGFSSPRRSLGAILKDRLALQLRSAFEMCLSCGGLMSAPPEGPCDHVSRVDTPLRQPHRNASDFLGGPADQFTL